MGSEGGEGCSGRADCLGRGTGENAVCSADLSTCQIMGNNCSEGWGYTCKRISSSGLRWSAMSAVD